MLISIVFAIFREISEGRVGDHEGRLFAFLVPVVLYLGYFIELMAMNGITWSIHLWLGSCVLAGIVGVMLSYLLVPPQKPVEIEQK